MLGTVWSAQERSLGETLAPTSHGAAMPRACPPSSPGQGLGTPFCLPILDSRAGTCPGQEQKNTVCPPEPVGAEEVSSLASWAGCSQAQPRLLMGSYSPGLLCHDPPEIRTRLCNERSAYKAVAFQAAGEGDPGGRRGSPLLPRAGSCQTPSAYLCWEPRAVKPALCITRICR